MNIWICDDLPSDISILKKYIGHYALEKNIDYKIQSFISAESFLNRISEDSFPHIIFLDIYINNSLGIDIAKKIYEMGYDGILIFVTTSPDFALESYKLNAEGYICKPIDYKDFCNTLNKCITKLKDSLNSIEIISNRTPIEIYLKDISYIESGNHCCYIHAKNKVLKTGKTIKDFEEQLCEDPVFIRCHQSFIVNLSYVKNYDNEFIYLKNGDEILISIRNSSTIKKDIANYFWSIT